MPENYYYSTKMKSKFDNSDFNVTREALIKWKYVS